MGGGLLMLLPEKSCGIGVLLFMILLVSSFTAERTNHEGRILGTVPAATSAIFFNTPQADAVMSTLQIFPRDHAWNEDISRRPVLANSPAILHLIVTILPAAAAGAPTCARFRK